MFTKDSRKENFLTGLGADWKYSNKKTFADLIPNWMNVNFGRSKNRVEEAILIYAERYQQNRSLAPAPILRPTKIGCEVLDGLQTLGAAELLGITEFSAYIVTTDSERLARTIRVLANELTQSSYGEPPQWTKRQAIDLLVNKEGMSLEELSRLTGWKISDLREEKTCVDTLWAVHCIGGPQELPKGVLLNIAEHSQLADFEKAGKPIGEFCHDLKRGRFSNGESKPYVENFFSVNRKAKDLHQEFTKNLDKFRRDEEVKTKLSGKRPTTPRDPGVELRGILRSALTVTEKLLQKKVRLVYCEEYHGLLNQIKGNVQLLSRKQLVKA